jgi:hypothetical protein
MLPKYVELDDIDDGIKNLVINLNRIPELDTQTTCEGHVLRNSLCILPSKDGWIHFSKPSKRYNHLNKKMKILFSQKYDFFNLHTWSIPCIPGEIRLFSSHTINACFEPHSDGDLFKRLDEKGKEAYFERADLRKIEILKGWADINQIVIDYIKRNISPDIDSLPYYDSESSEVSPFFSCH